MKKIILVFVICMLTLGFVSAKSSDLFNNYLGNKIYQDCMGHDLKIKPGIIGNNFNETITLIKWPNYDPNITTRLIELFGQNEPYSPLQGTCEDPIMTGGGRIDGCSILSCENKVLDVTQYTYLWNGERVEVPMEQYNSYIANANGDGSQACVGTDCKNIQFNFKLAFGITLSFAIFELGIIVTQFLINRKLKTKTKEHKTEGK
jgi:hypothetical protein